MKQVLHKYEGPFRGVQMVANKTAGDREQISISVFLGTGDKKIYTVKCEWAFRWAI